MACMTLLTQPVAMATTQLARVIRYEVSAPWQEHASGRQPAPELGRGRRQKMADACPACSGRRMGTAEALSPVCNIPLTGPA
jgi:hypothetical protein